MKISSKKIERERHMTVLVNQGGILTIKKDQARRRIITKSFFLSSSPHEKSTQGHIHPFFFPVFIDRHTYTLYTMLDGNVYKYIDKHM